MVAPAEVPAPSIEGIVTDIQALTEAIKLVDAKLAMMAECYLDSFKSLQKRVASLEKRHTAHLHWTNMGR